jgi:spore coat protein SA
MASGTPVVAVREAGPCETVVDGETGFLRERDADALAEAVARLLEDEDLRERMGRAGREHAVRRWTWDRSVEQLDELLCEAAESRHTSREGSRASDRVETELRNGEVMR